MVFFGGFVLFSWTDSEENKQGCQPMTLLKSQGHLQSSKFVLLLAERHFVEAAPIMWDFFQSVGAVIFLSEQGRG